MNVRLLCISGLCAVFAAAAGDPDRAEPAVPAVVRVDEQRLEALIAADVVALDRLLADDLVYVHASGRVQGKQGYLDLIARGTLQYLSLAYDESPTVRRYGDNVAVLTGRLRVEAKTPTTSPNRRLIATTAVYARTGGQWRLVSHHGTAIPPP